MLIGRPVARTRRRVVLLGLVLLMLALSLPVPVSAGIQNPCIAADEPNDQYAEALDLGAGEVCAEAANPTGGQDLYLWTVAAADATTRWTMSVSAIPGQLANLEIFDVVLDEAGNVTSAEKLLTVSGATDQTTIGRDLMLPIGKVITIGVATSGPGAYTLSVERAIASPPLNDSEPNDDATSATMVSGAFALAGDQSESPDEIAWTIAQSDAARTWTLRYQKPIAVYSTLTLRANDGTQLGSWGPTASGLLEVPNLSLAAGTYAIALGSTSPEDGPYILEMIGGEPLAAGAEAEPNDAAALGQSIDLIADSTAISGQLDTLSDVNDRDFYRFTIDGELASRQLDIKALWQQGPVRKMCLLDALEQELVCREGDRGAAFDDLILAEGEYFISVTGDVGISPSYLLRFDLTREASSGYEAEPNNTIEAASLLVPEGNTFVGSGRIETSDSDFFRFTVVGEPQLWLIEVTGPGVAAVELRDVVGTALATGSARDGVATLYDMFLLPGDQQIEIRGDSELYSVRLIPMGPPDPLAELEPNNSLDTSQALSLFEQRSGRLPTIEDADNYRFALQNDGYVRVSLAVPADGIVTASLSWQGRELVALATSEPGAPLVYEAWLRAGDYQLRLTSSAPSFDPYALEVLAIDPFDLPQDLEPNDTEFHAVAANYGIPVTGTGAAIMRSGDADWFAFPVLESGSEAVMTAVDEFTTRLYQRDPLNGVAIPIEVTTGTEEGRYLAVLPPDVEILMRVTIVGEYSVSLDLVGTEADGVPVIVIPALDPKVTVSIDAGDATVAAYWEDGQTLEGTVSLTNSGSEPVDLTLDAWIGDMRWSVSFAQPVIAVAAGETVTVPVQVAVAPDAWAERPIVLVVRATSDRGWATGESTITVGRSVPPVNPAVTAPLPESMLGGLNVAWIELGAVPDPAVGAESGFDGRIVSGFGVRADVVSLPHEITVDLAGDVPVPVSGFVIDPRGYDGLVLNQLRDFEVQVSTDGVTFATVLSGSMSGGQWEHGFALEDTVEATHVRLRMLTAQELDADFASFGEFKVAAQPGWSLPEAGNGLVLSDPALGGHVVNVQPPLSSSATYNELLIEDQAAEQVSLEPGATVTVTVGFHEDRAALINRITWQNVPALLPEQVLEIQSVEVAVDSSIGPWVAVGETRLEWDATGSAERVLETPVWARFVRVTYVVPVLADGDEAARYVYLPDALTIYEQPVADEYRSIIGEWGAANSEGIYEMLSPKPVLALDADAGNDQASATLLPLETSITNTAWVEQDVDWYRIDAPDDAGMLEFTLTGVPSVEVTVDLFDDAGQPVALRVSPDVADSLVLTATVDAGASYFLRVTEPPTNVIFAFDTSGSIGPFVTTVYQALRQYTADVETSQEVVNIVPFGRDVLLADWSGEPYLLQSAITNYPRMEGSSDADGALLTSMTALETQSGARVVVLITDNETAPTVEQLGLVWPRLEQVQPRVFGIQIFGMEESFYQQDVMQDWALANNGWYVYVQNQGEMDIAFDRAATVLRRPAIYSLTVQATAPLPTPTPEPTATAEPTPTPEPTPTAEPTNTPEPTAPPLADGSLSVIAPEVVAGDTLAIAEDVSVAIIFDTSGSMLQSLDGRSRADVAKESLMELVTTTIPPGTNVSLRTFGDEPDSCETRLVVPLSPLEPDSMQQVIADLPVVNLVKTPIGASLAEVGADLGTAPGPKIVVLVTDGEETCGGDPAAEIQRLIDSGIDVRVNIVGFALDDEALKAQFAEWAQIGNGRYIDAGNAEELTAAIAESVQPTFDVVDAEGVVVVSGQVGGEPVVVPPGTYTVIVQSAPEVRIDDVVVQSEQETDVEIGGP